MSSYRGAVTSSGGPRSNRAPSEVTLTDRAVELADPAQRRAAPRYMVELDLSIGGDHNFYAGFVENVSVGGVFIATHLCRPIGERIEITIHMPQGDSPVRGLGEVRWVRAYSEEDNTPPGMGVRFLELHEGSQESIERFLGLRPPLLVDDAQ